MLNFADLTVSVGFLGQIYISKKGRLINRCIRSRRNRLGFCAEIQIILGQCVMCMYMLLLTRNNLNYSSYVCDHLNLAIHEEEQIQVQTQATVLRYTPKS